MGESEYGCKIGSLHKMLTVESFRMERWLARPNCGMRATARTKAVVGQDVSNPSSFVSRLHERFGEVHGMQA